MTPADHVGQARTGEGWTGRLQGISVSGRKVVLGRRFEPGTLLVLELTLALGLRPCLLLAHVVRATAEAEAQWALGCAFTMQLSEPDLQALLT